MAENHQTELVYIHPNKLAQKGCVERFNRTFCEAVLDACLFSLIRGMKDIAEERLEDYNAIRPYETLDGLLPYQYTSHQA